MCDKCACLSRPQQLSPSTSSKHVDVPFSLRCHHYKGEHNRFPVSPPCLLPWPLPPFLFLQAGPHILGFRFSHLLQQQTRRLQADAAAPSDKLPPKPSHFSISSVQSIGVAVRTVLTQHMHRDAEDILNNTGRGTGCHGTYNVAWYKCSPTLPLSDDASSIMQTMFSDNRCVLCVALRCLRRCFVS